MHTVNTGNRIVGTLCLLSALWLFVAFLALIVWALVPGSFVGEPSYEADATELNAFIFQTFCALCGLILAPLFPLFIFALVYGEIQRQRVGPKIPIRFTLLSLCLAATLTALKVREFDIDAFPDRRFLLGQSVFAAIGIWLVLSNLYAIKHQWLPKWVSFSGLVVGGAWFLIVYSENWSTWISEIYEPLWNTLFWVNWMIYVGAASVWAAGLGVWVRKQ
ncbi:MAG: hypothetical protein KC519_19655 [Anaerolineae bacterium]|nr:hypothetical protein [Anaerolineae bacterium]